MTGLSWYLLGTLVLAVALFYPMRNIIWVLSVRRLERKTEQPLNDEERAGQLQRAGFIASLVALVFSSMFNYAFFGISKTRTGSLLLDVLSSTGAA